MAAFEHPSHASRVFRIASRATAEGAEDAAVRLHARPHTLRKRNAAP